jgi:hypothetical protein
MNMKKLLLAIPLIFLPLIANAQVPVVASFGIQSGNSTSTAVTAEVQIFTACSQAAIEARDSAIGSARTAYNNAMNIALDSRKEAEKSAVAIRDGGDKKDAIKSAVDEYKKAVTQAQDALTKARKEAWDTFEANTIACRDSNESRGNEVSNQSVSQKNAAPAASLKSENKTEKATARTMQAETTSEDSSEVKVEIKSFGDIIKAQIDSILNFFKK